MLKSFKLSYGKNKFALILTVGYVLWAVISLVLDFKLAALFAALEVLCYLCAVTFSANKNIQFNFYIGCVVFTVASMVGTIYTVGYNLSNLYSLLVSLCVGCDSYLKLREMKSLR